MNDIDNSNYFSDSQNGDRYQLPLGTALGSGTVTSILGKGGCATVYEIWNQKLEVKRAVKLINPGHTPQSLDRFETEIKISAKHHHPNIIEIHNVGELNGLPYIEMEIINGFSLKHVIAEKGALPVEVATAIFIFVCRALIYAHEQDIVLYGKQRKGIVHCDIKPANIMITHHGEVKLTDFGLATPIDVLHQKEKQNFSGTFHYASPEQLNMQKLDERTDIYSLSIVMYELYSGKRAFHGNDLDHLIQNRLNDVYAPLHVRCEDIDPTIKKIIQKGMAFNREDRYSTVRELLGEVEKLFSKISSVSPERIVNEYFSNEDYSTLAKKLLKRRAPAIILTMVACLVISGIFFVITNHFNASNNSSLPQKSTSNKSGVNDTGFTIAITEKSETTSTNNTSATETPRQQPKQPSSYASFDVIRTALQKKEYTKAGKLLKAVSVEDGEYYFLYGEYLAAEGSYTEALSYVEKGFKTTSKRLSAEQHRLHYTTSKARCLTTAFDRTAGKERGAKAMEAWFDVKYILKDKRTSVQYSYADSEIRRIHTILQNAPK